MCILGETKLGRRIYGQGGYGLRGDKMWEARLDGFEQVIRGAQAPR